MKRPGLANGSHSELTVSHGAIANSHVLRDGHSRTLTVSRRGGCGGNSSTRTGRGAEGNVLRLNRQQDMEPLIVLHPEEDMFLH